MSEIACETIDPRVRRTRHSLQQALGRLLETKEFDLLSVQDITDAAALNRATFYDHYPDKFALLECMVAGRFSELLAARGVKFDGTCASAVNAIVLGVCDYLAGMRQKGQHLESAVIAVVRRMILDGLTRHPSKSAVPAAMIATTVSWAIYGGATEWLQTEKRCPSEVVAAAVAGLVAPMLHGY